MSAPVGGGGLESGGRQLPLRCTVRGCGRELAVTAGGLSCGAGHSFDRARGGWYHLAQPQDSRSMVPGDSEEAILARVRLRALGLGEALVEAAASLAGEWEGVGLDVGCGDGALLARLPAPGRELFGIDLSKAAAKVAARRRVATILVANADRGLPLGDRTVVRVFSLNARRPQAELARVLAPGGRLIVAVPAPDDLLELREAVLGQGTLLPGGDALVRELADRFEPTARLRVEERQMVSGDSLLHVAAASYRLARRRERATLLAAGTAEVAMRHDLVSFTVRDTG